MRYTTVIDISEIDRIYKNPTAVRVYLHLCLKAGWHDYDRDLVQMSFRKLAAQLDITDAACRHAVAVLERYQLLRREGNLWQVRKFITEQPVSARARSEKQQKAIEAAAARKREQEQHEREMEVERIRRQQLESEGKTGFMAYYEELQRKAAAGDVEAAEKVKRRAAQYEQHRQAQESKKASNQGQ